MTDWFYVITITYDGGGATLQGIHPQRDGETRQQAFTSILDWAQEQVGRPVRTVTLFYLEPNSLGGQQ